MFLANLGGDNAIANLGGDNAIAKKNNYHGSLGKVFRAGSTKAANNAVRAELLRSLGNTVGLSNHRIIYGIIFLQGDKTRQSPENMSMEFNELLSRFADRYAVEGIDATDGVAVLSVDGTEVTFREDAAGGAVVLAAEIGEMPPDASGVFASVALQANYAAVGGTALCVDAETDLLSVATSLPLALADPDALSVAVESLVNTAEEWRRNAVAFLEVDEEAAFSDAEAADANPLSGDSGFLRV